ncbi:MFS transporter [Reinekea marinisedimentorum]|uniref:Putative MFS family arabinose efflux permease n=1 Tax=Reinekea marinisedimentorum TaxID=230495 RepID=A0A4R3IBC3_9GAMM|nr:MFS transporter [Reinekea marinisedimentorum]TCS43910.1 putative MFS family arabinose efflux permease [Reinekea marinisedimentorum]
MFANSALHNPDYRKFFIASCFATMALWMMRFLFGWLIWEATKSFFWVGMASTGMLLPSLVITPISGVISDRINLRSGIMGCLSVQVTVSFITLFTFLLADPSLSILLLLTFIFGCASAASSPFRLSITPRLVGRTLLPNAVGLGAIVFNTSRILAPALAASLLTITGAIWVLCLCALFFAVAVYFNSCLPSLPPAPKKEGSSGWQEFKGGLVFAWQSPYVRLMLIITLINSQVARALIELLPALSGTFTEGQPSDLAMLTACAGGGSILGGLFIARQKGEVQRMVTNITLSMALTAAAILPLLFSPNILLLTTLVGAISLFMTIIGTGSQISVQMMAEDAIRGRIMSLFITVALAGPAFGAFIMGTIAEFIGFRLMLIAMLLLSSLGSYWLFSQNKQIKNESGAQTI